MRYLSQQEWYEQRLVTDGEWNVIRAFRIRAGVDPDLYPKIQWRARPGQVLMHETARVVLQHRGEPLLMHETARVVLQHRGEPYSKALAVPTDGEPTVLDADSTVYCVGQTHVATPPLCMANTYIGERVRVYGFVGNGCTIGHNTSVYADAVVSTSWIAPGSAIRVGATVFGSRLDRRAVVGHKASLAGVKIDAHDVYVHDSARLYNCTLRTSVGAPAHIDGRRRELLISEPEQFMGFNGLGSRRSMLTFWMHPRATRNPHVGVSTGCFTGDVYEFVNAVRSRHGSGRSDSGQHYNDYIDAVELALKRFARHGYAAPDVAAVLKSL